MGNGFSRMLQMLNVDNRRSDTYHHHSEHESGSDNEKPRQHTKREKELLLPIVRPVGNKLNMSDGNIGNDDLPNIDDEHLKPKV
jgi:hypothetical protein